MSVVDSWLDAPSSPTKAGLNFLNAPSSSSGWPPGSLPAVRSPRQCIGPALAIPRRLCVVIGPFIGWNVWFDEIWSRNGFGLFVTVPNGSPRSQASPSKSPEMWQLAHALSPLADLVASYR